MDFYPYRNRKKISHVFWLIWQKYRKEYCKNIGQISGFAGVFMKISSQICKYLNKLCFDDDIQVKIWETKDIAKVFKKSGQKLVKFGTWFSGNLKLTTLLCFKNIL